MKRILETVPVNSVKSLREMMDIIDESALGSAVNAAKNFGGGAMTGIKYPYSANLNPLSGSATMRGIRTGAPIGKHPAEFGAGAAAIGAAGAASELGDTADPELLQPYAASPQDPTTRGDGYADSSNPVKTNGILDDATTKALAWERQSAERDARITGYDELNRDIDQTITPLEPFDNTQGDFDRMPELNESSDLPRILQLAQWR